MKALYTDDLTYQHPHGETVFAPLAVPVPPARTVVLYVGRPDSADNALASLAQYAAGRGRLVAAVWADAYEPADRPRHQRPVWTGSVVPLLLSGSAGGLFVPSWHHLSAIADEQRRLHSWLHHIGVEIDYLRRTGQAPLAAPRSRSSEVSSFTTELEVLSSRRALAVLGEMLREHCSLHNGALQERRDAYRHTSKITVRYGQQSAQLKEIRAFDPERQGRWSFSSQQATLRRLDKAFQAFFRRVKAGEKPGYPRFRGVNWFDTVDFPKDGDGCRWDSTPHGPVTRVRLQGVGHVRVHQHRPVKGRVKTVSVKRGGKHWYVLLACDEVPAEPLRATGAVTGIDMGVTHFLTTSEGAHVANPRHGKRNAEAQRTLQAFPRRKRADRSAKHRRAVEKVAGCTARYAASAPTTHTKPRSPWSATTTRSHTNG